MALDTQTNLREGPPTTVVILEGADYADFTHPKKVGKRMRKEGEEVIFPGNYANILLAEGLVGRQGVKIPKEKPSHLTPAAYLWALKFNLGAEDFSKMKGRVTLDKIKQYIDEEL